MMGGINKAYPRSVPCFLVLKGRDGADVAFRWSCCSWLVCGGVGAMVVVVGVSGYGPPTRPPRKSRPPPQQDQRPPPSRRSLMASDSPPRTQSRTAKAFRHPLDQGNRRGDVCLHDRVHPLLSPPGRNHTPGHLSGLLDLLHRHRRRHRRPRPRHHHIHHQHPRRRNPNHQQQRQLMNPAISTPQQNGCWKR